MMGDEEMVPGGTSPVGKIDKFAVMKDATRWVDSELCRQLIGSVGVREYTAGRMASLSSEDHHGGLPYPVVPPSEAETQFAVSIRKQSMPKLSPHDFKRVMAANPIGHITAQAAAEVRKMEVRIQDLTHEVDELSDIINSLHAQLHGMRQRAERAEAQFRAEQARADGLQARADGLQATVDVFGL